MSSIKYSFFTLSFLFIFSGSTLADENCDFATDLVIQAFDAGDLGRQDEEKRLLLRALRFCPNHADAHNNLATLFKAEGNDDLAIAHYRLALQIKPNFSFAWYGLGEVYFEQGQFPLSLYAHLQACQSDKDSKLRVADLLINQKYAVSAEGKILNKESLLCLFDAKRRQTINQLLSDCGFRIVRVKPAVVFYNIQFDTGRATLKSGTEAQLEALAAALINLQNRFVKIHGHTDNQVFVGYSPSESKRLNLILSEKRAASVARALASRGVSMNRLRTFGYGNELPLVSGSSSAARAKNRRVEIEVPEVEFKE